MTNMINDKMIIHGDNLDIMRQYCVTGSIDLCYADPLYNSNRNYKQFSDKWKWDASAISNYNQLKHLKYIQGIYLINGNTPRMAYLCDLTLRIIEIHRILKQKGSFYLHCDPTEAHYIKLILDAIFCPMGSFLNEIIWSYRTGGMSKRWFGRKHDTIFVYVKDKNNYTFNNQKEKSYISHKYGFTNVEILQEPEPDNRYYTLVGVRDVWTFDALRGNQAENLHYPTQKPISLLNRIISVSSNVNDLILDPYCGSGTTLFVAKKLNRRWLGIDSNKEAISITNTRLEQ